MFLSAFASDVVAKADIPKLLAQQSENLRKAEELRKHLEKLKETQLHKAVKPIVKNMYDASNTLPTPIFDASSIPWLDKAGHFFSAMDTIGNYITHPILIVNAISGASYWVCLFIGIGGLIYYMVGNKKGLKWTSGSLLSYILIETLNKGLSVL